MSRVVSWIKPNDHFNDYELAQKGIRLVEPDNSNKYYWMVDKVLVTSSYQKKIMHITNMGIMFRNTSGL